MTAAKGSKHSSEDLKVEIGDKESEHASPGVPLDAHYDPRYVSRTLRKIDLRMLPLLGLLYALALIDRTNLGIARVAGMEKDLRLDIGERYGIASMIYFPLYILLEIPGNLILQFLGARTWLTLCVLGWGASQVGMAFVPNWGLLCLTRVLLGIFEAGFFPALVFIITTWYKRGEVQTRLAAFYITGIVLGGFSAILAYGFQLIAPAGGLNGWQWIFLIEGLLTVVLGVLFWFFVPDFPNKNKFLSPEETKMVLDRIEEDRKDSVPDLINAKIILKHLSDPLVWSYGLIFLAGTMPSYAIGFFITILLSSMGFTLMESFLLSTPPYIAAAISAYAFAWISDRTRKRALWIAVQTFITITGLLIIGYAKPHGARYFGIFLANMGATGCVPATLAYNANNIVSYSKRSVSTATIIPFGGIGGIFATLVFRQRDFPTYIPGIWATIACQFLALSLLALNTVILSRRNKLAREGKRINEGVPGFMYTL